MNISLVTGSIDTLTALKNQLGTYLNEGYDISYYAEDAGIDEVITGDLIIVSSRFAYNDLTAKKLLDRDSEIIIAERTIDFDGLDEIVALSVGTKVLLVNDLRETTNEVIENLKEIGVTGLEFVPYFPGCDQPIDRPSIAITPGESAYVPKWVTTVIDIGPRVMDFPTILDILSKTGRGKSQAGYFTRAYLRKIIKMNQIVSASRNEIAHLNDKLSSMLNRLGDGLLLFEGSGRVLVANQRVRQLLRLENARPEGRLLSEIISDAEIIKALMSKNQEQIVDTRSGQLSVALLEISEGQFLATFKSIEDSLLEHDRLKRELVRKGFYAKYAFEDIVGRSSALERAKKISKKLAASTLTILLQGESGTGKELFASAVHNASSRRKGPFLAVNFSALPDNLLESELFGYEEGAFTGAKKGGKPGLFEQAHGGTLFLDEIGDISFKMQARLLRVLQENEIMRVGGSEIRTVDVRVVAATHRNLFKMVQEGQFREDLYYRLKTGVVHLPPLRERKDDIPLLVGHFLKVSGIPGLSMDPDALSALISEKWYGNIRELENAISYMIAVRSSTTLGYEDLPEVTAEVQEDRRDRNLEVSDIQRFILETVAIYEQRGDILGRKQLAMLSEARGYDLSENQVRTKLNHLEQLGLIYKGKGKVGTKLTESGRVIIWKEDASKSH